MRFCSPSAFLNPRTTTVLTWVSGLGTLTLLVILSASDSRFVSYRVNDGIQNLLTSLHDNGGVTADYWSREQMSAATYWLNLDFVFAAFYSVFLSLLCSSFSSEQAGTWERTGKIMSWAVLLGGFVDVVENLALLSVIETWEQQVPLPVVNALGQAKWILPGLSIIYILGGKIRPVVNVARWVALILFLVALTGYLLSLPLYSHLNEPLPEGQPLAVGGLKTARFPGYGTNLCTSWLTHPIFDRPDSPFVKSTQARYVRPSDLHNGIFVGIAISGGGSRAANFSAASLFELEKLGLLKYVTAISSVSGGSITAAYYGLFHGGPEWGKERVRERLAFDFETPAIHRAFYPHNYLRYWATAYTRSDIMAGVLDDELFKGKTFSDLENPGPVILLNSTIDQTTGCTNFAFRDEVFLKMSSRLDTYPLANAVMASAALPGVFSSIGLRHYTLAQHNRPDYQHLYDGGPSDNLGISTLLHELNQLTDPQSPKESLRGCFLLVIDSYSHAPP